MGKNKKTPSPEAQKQAILDALADYQKEGALPKTATALAKRLKAESDRGKVIILVTFIEDALIERLCKRIRVKPESRSKFAKQSLSSFATTIAMAKTLDLIDEKTATALDVLRLMRNACAHSRKGISFETPELQDATLLLMSNPPDESREALKNALPLIAQNVFMIVAGMMLGIVKGKRVRRTSYGLISNPDLARALDAVAILQGVPASLLKKRIEQQSQGSRPPPNG